MEISDPKFIGAALIVLITIFGGITYLVGSPAEQQTASDPLAQVNQPNVTAEVYMKTRIKTEKGDIVLELYPQVAPKTVENFTKLAQQGFYNGVSFHRVIKGFMIQGGDPTGTGSGGPGYTFEDEINPVALGLSEPHIAALQAEGFSYRNDLNSLRNDVGAISMANAGPNTNGSQFFIISDSAQRHLDGRHTVFGKVVEGLEVVRTIAQGDKMISVTIE